MWFFYYYLCLAKFSDFSLFCIDEAHKKELPRVNFLYDFPPTRIDEGRKVFNFLFSHELASSISIPLSTLIFYFFALFPYTILSNETAKIEVQGWINVHRLCNKRLILINYNHMPSYSIFFLLLFISKIIALQFEKNYFSIFPLVFLTIFFIWSFPGKSEILT